MKCAVVFLVLSMVVLMAEPGECFFGRIFRGIYHGVRRLVHGKENLAEDQVEQQQQQQERQEQEQLDKRSFQHKFARNVD
ncbi:pleurocidin-like peptide WF3 [Odontesthes bonariensis]|uniref:pleurocidin-like peptide WF3 n=1 Tax=Odontesthes bonariensis TaxID=219752 RepID=UPI003F58EDDB